VTLKQLKCFKLILLLKHDVVVILNLDQLSNQLIAIRINLASVFLDPRNLNEHLLKEGCKF